MSILSTKPLSNPQGDMDKNSRRMIDGNTTNLNDFNNAKYTRVGSQYRQVISSSWIPGEINLSVDLKDYKNLTAPKGTAYDKILSFLVFLDSIQTVSLPCIAQYITANEVDLCLTIQRFQEVVHSQSHSYMPDSIRSPVEQDRILYQWKEGEHPLRRNTFIGDLYNKFQEGEDDTTFLRVTMANYILGGIYFYSGFMLFYNLGKNGKTSGGAQEIRYINRDENTHLWLFRNVIGGLRKEEPQLFTPGMVDMLKSMLEEDVTQEVRQESYVIGDDVPGLTGEMVADCIRYLGSLRWGGLGFGTLYEGHDEEPEPVKWVNQYSNTNMVKTDFLRTKNITYAKDAVIVDGLQT